MDDVLENAVSAEDIQEYLIFTVNSIDFGIEIGLVQESSRCSPFPKFPTRCPSAGGSSTSAGPSYRSSTCA
jgi:hypothetical protein